MLSRALGTLVAALALPLLVAAPRAAADAGAECPPGTNPVRARSGVDLRIRERPRGAGTIR